MVESAISLERISWAINEAKYIVIKEDIERIIKIDCNEDSESEDNSDTTIDCSKCGGFAISCEECQTVTCPECDMGCQC